MPFSTPNLDDRDFRQLVSEAQDIIKKSCPSWTDLSPSDPGMVLVELFAHMTELMLYKLNRLPEKAYAEFLRLMGVTILAPSAASVQLHFSLAVPQDQQIEIPRGTQVTAVRTGSDEPPAFVTARRVLIAAGETAVEVLAHHCEQIEGELAAIGTSQPGQVVTAQHPPIVSPLRGNLDMTVGVAMDASASAGRLETISYEGNAYAVWREVENFTDVGEDRFVYVVDRAIGQVTFAPALYGRDELDRLERARTSLAEVPPAGHEIRLWYRRGGGLEGNVAANTLTVMKDVLPGVDVTNPEPATGGRAQETLENALSRGPEEVHSRNRAVTARDYEIVALRSTGAVARAKAFTEASEWCYAAPGSVNVLVVPALPDEVHDLAGGVSPDTLRQRQTVESISRIVGRIDERRPIGTKCKVEWVRYKTVYVKANIVVYRGENPAVIKERVLRRLYALINPLPSPVESAYRLPGWQFGESLRASDVYDIILQEPGVRYADKVRLYHDEVPVEGVTALAADCFQSNTWWAAAGSNIYRSLNNGKGWEQVHALEEGESGTTIESNPHIKGLLAIATEFPDRRSRVHISPDCGGTWFHAADFAFQVEDLAWMPAKEGGTILLLATRKGLYRISVDLLKSPPQLSTPRLVVVDEGEPDRGFYAVAASLDIPSFVATAAMSNSGVYLSGAGGIRQPFRHCGLSGEDVRHVMVQHDGPRAFLWAGTTVARRGSQGKGCFRVEVVGTETTGDWTLFGANWQGGSCYGLAALDNRILAATYQGGVLWLKPTERRPNWNVPDLESCGLPPRPGADFAMEPVLSVAASPTSSLVMAGGDDGVFRAMDNLDVFESCSQREHVDEISVPTTWLFCSGKHQIDILADDA